jgi:GT2 family glycosyltransferase
MNMFVRSEVFKMVGGFNDTLVTCEDVDLSYRLAKQGKIISDQCIEVIHHGEAKDIAEFFRKERWRGKSNYQGLKAHGIQLAEIPSLILPLYFLLMVIPLLFFALRGQWRYAIITGILWQLPVVAMAFLKAYKASALDYTLRLFLLYNVYYWARGLAIFG